MTIHSSKSIGWVFAAVLVTVQQLPASAQSDYPNRAIRIIVPTAPAGGNDTVGRVIAQGLTERWGRQVVVDNRAGASTMIGGEMVAKAPPDGYTLLMGVSTLAINPATFRKVPYEAIRDFTPITQAVFVPNLMMVHPSVPAKTVKEMIAFAKARPGQVLMASAGFGTNPHLSMELFASMAQIRLIHVPYKSSTPGIIDLIAGHVAIMAPNMLQSIPHVRAGRLRALAVAGKQRSQIFPDLPRLADVYPGLEVTPWLALFAPAGVPEAVLARLRTEVNKLLQDPEQIRRLGGLEPYLTTPEQFDALLHSEYRKYGEIVKAVGVRID